MCLKALSCNACTNKLLKGYIILLLSFYEESVDALWQMTSIRHKIPPIPPHPHQCPKSEYKIKPKIINMRVLANSQYNPSQRRDHVQW